MKRLHQKIVRTHAYRLFFVKRLEGADQEYHRHFAEFGVLADALADLVAVKARHVHIGHHQVGRELTQMLDGGVAVADGDHVYAFIGKSQIDDLLDRRRIVCK